MAKQPKLISVEKLKPLNPKNDREFLMIYRRAVILALQSERETGQKHGRPGFAAENRQ